MAAPVSAADFEELIVPQFEGLGTVYKHKKGDLVLNGQHGYEFIKKGYLNQLKPREGDAIVATFPKAGTTWAQELVYLIKTDADFESAKASFIGERFPYMELQHPDRNRTFEGVLSMKEPRLFKTHYPLYVLPEDVVKQTKIVYTARNIKDSIVSYYFFSKSNPLIDYKGDFPTFVDHFLNDRVIYASYWRHVIDGFERRHQPNILFLLFEDMKKDLPSIVRQTASFFDKQLTEEQVAKVSEHCSFGSMKANKATNYSTVFSHSSFMRKGDVGDWKNHFTEEINDKVNRYLEKYLGDIPDLKFDYEL